MASLTSPLTHPGQPVRKSTGKLRHSLGKAFNPEQPRGQPENAGQFGPGGNASKAPKPARKQSPAAAKLAASRADAKKMKAEAKAGNDKAKAAEKEKKVAEKTAAAAVKKKDAAKKKHEKQLGAVKAAEAGMTKAKTQRGRDAAQKRIDKAQAKAKETEAAAKAASGEPAKAMAAPAAPKSKYGVDPAYEAKKKVVDKWKTTPMDQVDAKSSLADKMKQYKPVKTKEEAAAYATNVLKIGEVKLGDDMEVNNHTMAVLTALKGSFKLPHVVETTAFSKGDRSIGRAGNGVVGFNPEQLASAVKGQAASQENGDKPKWFTTNDPAHFVTHEVGHFLHESSGGYKDNVNKEKKFQDSKANLTDLSEYGKSNHREMVAEVFAGKVLGTSFSPATMKLYKEFGGPMHHTW